MIFLCNLEDFCQIFQLNADDHNWWTTMPPQRRTAMTPIPTKGESQTPSKHPTPHTLIITPEFTIINHQINIWLLSAFSVCPAPWEDWSCGQNKHRTFQPRDVTPILQTTSTIIMIIVLDEKWFLVPPTRDYGVCITWYMLPVLGLKRNIIETSW